MKDDTVAHIGKLLPDGLGRDAIHIAVAPVIYIDGARRGQAEAKTLKPGQHVGLNSFGWVDPDVEPIGIVDPYLKAPVKERERFFLFLYPGTITSLRHEWTHPAFTGPIARRWLADFALDLNIDYEEMMGAARAYIASETTNTPWEGEYHFVGDNERYKNITTDQWHRFWDHVEEVEGVRVAQKSVVPFSCSC